MDPIEKRELKRQAWLRLTAQRRRAGQLRGRVVALSLICFATLWGVVFAQMATGNDPVLSAKEKAAVTRATASARQELETTDPREADPEHRTDPRARARPEEVEVEAEPEAEEFIEAEPETEEVFEEAEPEFVEAEPEPLVTSQS